MDLVLGVYSKGFVEEFASMALGKRPQASFAVDTYDQIPIMIVTDRGCICALRAMMHAYPPILECFSLVGLRKASKSMIGRGSLLELALARGILLALPSSKASLPSSKASLEMLEHNFAMISSPDTVVLA